MVKREQDLLQETRRLYEATFRFDARASAALGVHATDLRCINALENGPLSAGEIGQRLALTSGSVTALIGRLARSGYVRQVRDSLDRRRILVALTPVFRAESDGVYARLGLAITSAFADASDSERTIAIDVLRRLTIGFSVVAGELDRMADESSG